MEQTVLPESVLLRLTQIVPAIVPVANSTWWKWVKAGKAPQPVRLGRVTAWRAEDIRAFIEGGIKK